MEAPNKIVCSFSDGNTHTFASEDAERVRGWFRRLQEVEDMNGIELFIDGDKVAEANLYRKAV
jgi:hypothetical protein